MYMLHIPAHVNSLLILLQVEQVVHPSFVVLLREGGREGGMDGGREGGGGEGGMDGVREGREAQDDAIPIPFYNARHNPSPAFPPSMKYNCIPPAHLGDPVLHVVVLPCLDELLNLLRQRVFLQRPICCLLIAAHGDLMVVLLPVEITEG